MISADVESPPAQRPGLDDRYGRTKERRLRARWFVVGSAIAFVAVFTAWVVWGGLDGDSATMETRDLGFVTHGNTSTDVKFELTMDAGKSASCAVEALSEQFQVVGWKVIDIPASSERTRQFTESLRTIDQAVTGLIYRCWLT